jgi:O-antigen ligase
MAVEQSGSSKNVKFKGSGGKLLQVKTPLVPKWLLYAAFFISFSVPNLVFSGRYWFDTLHLMKWTVTIVPIGVLALFAGIILASREVDSVDFILDPFGALWLLLVLLITVQPFFIQITSFSTFAKEWFYFAALFATYMLAYNACKDGKLHRALLWGSSVNASVNVLFAEMLMKNLNKGYPFILDVPGNYIGNIAQQEMFGLWMAMAVLNCIFLHLHYVGQLKEGERLTGRPALFSIVSLNLFFLAVNAYGLWSSTARGGILSLVVAFVVLVVGLWRSDNTEALKRSFKLFGLVIVLLAAILGGGYLLGVGRGGVLVSKMMDMIRNPTSVGNRISIWRTSFEIFKSNPVTGVGLGHYKWHFLDGQRELYRKNPELLDKRDYEWQYTYWAHSEYIQWLCETGIIGAALLAVMGAWWLYSFHRAMIRKEHLPPEALWGCAMLFLLWFNALFSRPFHRIENSVWMSLAFALANRSILPQRLKWTSVDSEWVYRVFGFFIAAVSIYGFVFLAGGIQGDQLIYKSVSRPSTFQEKDALLKRAERNLMSRDDAREQYGYLYLELGNVQKDQQVFVEGVRSLYSAFLRRPTSKLLFELMGLAKQIDNNELFSILGTYLGPYTLESISAGDTGESGASGASGE